jgi:hypothetical protein
MLQLRYVGLLVLSVGEVAVDRWNTKLSGTMMTELKPRVSVEWQLVDPLSGQVVYADTGYYQAGDWDQAGRYWTEAGYQSGEVPRYREGAIELKPILLSLIQKSLGRAVQEIVKNFSLQRLNALCLVQTSTDGKPLVILDQGRGGGVFPGMKLVAASDRRVLTVRESYADYALGQVAGNQEVKGGEVFSGYALPAGEAQELSCVGRIIISKGLQKNPLTQFLEKDRALLEQALRPAEAGTPLPRPPATWQGLLSKHLTQALAEGGGWRMGFPAGGSASVKLAKKSMNEELSLKQEESDPLFFESFVQPDQIVAVLVSGLSEDRQQVEENKNGKFSSYVRLTYGLRVALIVYDLSTGEIISGATADGEKWIRERRESEELQTMANDSPEVILGYLLRSTLDLAAKKLRQNYQAKTQETTVQYSPEKGQLTAPSLPRWGSGQRIELHGEIARQGEKKFYGQKALLVCGKHLTPEVWPITLLTGSLPTNSSTDYRVRWLAPRATSTKIGQPVRVVCDEVTLADQLTTTINANDIEIAALGALASQPDYQPVFAPELRRQLRAFDQVKFGSDQSFQNYGSLAVWQESAGEDATRPLYFKVVLANAQSTPSTKDKTKKQIVLAANVELGLKDGSVKPYRIVFDKSEIVPSETKDGAARAQELITTATETLVQGFAAARLSPTQTTQ